MFGRLLFRVKVSGESCWPDLVSGKTYFASRLRKPCVGDYVVFPFASIFGSPTSEYAVKKIKRIEDDTLHVAGTVSWATSHVVRRSAVLGTLLARNGARERPTHA